MARFPRPAGAIEDVKELKVGDLVYPVLGIWPPVAYTSPMKITREVVCFADHPEYESLHKGQADLAVFDWAYLDKDLTVMRFASDYNMTPETSHNDNYLFRTKEEADEAVQLLRGNWEANPDLIQRELERQEDDRIFNMIADDYFYSETFCDN